MSNEDEANWWDNHVRTNRVSLTLELKLETFFKNEDREAMLSQLESTLKSLPFVGYVDTEVDV